MSNRARKRYTAIEAKRYQPMQEPVERPCPYCACLAVGNYFFDQNCRECVRRMTEPPARDGSRD